MKTILQTALLSPALLLSLIAVQPLRAAALATPEPASTTTDDTAYTAGTRAMNQQQWNDAVASFDKVINAKTNRVDAALYWKAYSLNKLGNKGLALATCFQLRSQYKTSPWNKDCSALSIDLNDTINTAVNNAMANVHIDIDPSLELDVPTLQADVRDDPNDDIKILALNSLLHQDPARALPILRGILANSQSSPGMKRRALFILAQSKSPEAQTILHDAIIGKMDPALQRQAIQSIAVFQGKRDNDTLVEVYRTTADPQIKRAVVSALFITNDAPRLIELARNEKDLNLKRNIVSQLAIMHDQAATDYMLELLK
jgi:hypothetical protein